MFVLEHVLLPNTLDDDHLTWQVPMISYDYLLEGKFSHHQFCKSYAIWVFSFLPSISLLLISMLCFSMSHYVTHGHRCVRETLRTRWSKWSTMFPRRWGGFPYMVASGDPKMAMDNWCWFIFGRRASFHRYFLAHKASGFDPWKRSDCISHQKHSITSPFDDCGCDETREQWGQGGAGVLDARLLEGIYL